MKEVTLFYPKHVVTAKWKGSKKNLEHYVMSHTVSTMKGFVNEVIGQTYGVSLPVRAIIEEHGVVLAKWEPGRFTAMPSPVHYPLVALA